MFRSLFFIIAMNLAILLVVSISLPIIYAIFTSLGFKINVGGFNVTYYAILAVLFGFGGSFISLWLSKYFAKTLTGARVINNPSNQKEAWLVDTVNKMADQTGIKRPEVAIFNSNSPNAFATGPSKNNSLVAISEGMLNTFEENEIEAVIGHEIGHVANGDMVNLTLIMGVLNSFVIFLSHAVAFIIDKVILKSRDGHGIGYFIGYFVASIIFSIVASIIAAYFSRQREFKADAAGAELTTYDDMIKALQRLQSMHCTELPDSMVAFGISSNKISNLFSTHPPIALRIKALQNRSVKSGIVINEFAN